MGMHHMLLWLVAMVAWATVASQAWGGTSGAQMGPVVPQWSAVSCVLLASGQTGVWGSPSAQPKQDSGGAEFHTPYQPERSPSGAALCPPYRSLCVVVSHMLPQLGVAGLAAAHGTLPRLWVLSAVGPAAPGACDLVARGLAVRRDWMGRWIPQSRLMPCPAGGSCNSPITSLPPCLEQLKHRHWAPMQLRLLAEAHPGPYNRVGRTHPAPWGDARGGGPTRKGRPTPARALVLLCTRQVTSTLSRGRPGKPSPTPSTGPIIPEERHRAHA